MMLAFADFGPDRSAFDPAFSDRLENVLPGANGFKPFPAFTAQSDPLPARPQGAFLATNSAGNWTLFVGTADALYTFDGPTLGWNDVSGPAAPYSTPDSVRWSFTQYGAWVVATNGVDPIQYFDLDLPTTFETLAASAPRPRFIDILGDFLFASHLTTNDRAVHWSGLDDPQFWTPRQRSSDFQPFPDNGEIMGTAGFEKGIVIFHEHCIREGALALHTSLVMTFQKTVEHHGTMAPRSIVTTGAGIFYLSQDGFYRYGSPPMPIGVERVDRFFQEDADQSEIYDVYGTEDPDRKIVYWAYRSTENTMPRSYDRILVYHYGIDKWSLLNPGLFLTGLIDATSPGYTLDSLDSLGIPLDDLPFSLDSRAWSGSLPTLAAFDSQFRLGFFAGSPLPALLQTGDTQMADGKRAFVRGFRALTDAPSIEGRVAIKDNAGQPRIWKPNAAASTRTGLIPARATGRFHRFELGIPNGQEWSHVHGVEPEAALEGDH